MKILITADGHHSKFMFKKNEECIKFTNDSILKESPRLFIHAGDLNDSQHIKSGSEEYRALIKYIKETSKFAKEHGVDYIILRGTKGHDGEVIRSIHESLIGTDAEFIYIDTPTVLYYDNYSILFLPEMYTTSYDEFEHIINTTINDQPVDVVIFHGMFDFAIPQLKQIDSSYNLSRSVVIDSKKFNKIFNICAVGGHVHAKIKHSNIIYTDSMINSMENTDISLGIGKLQLVGKYYDYSTIQNPFNSLNKIINLNFTRNTFDEIEHQIRSALSDGTSLDNIIFNCITSSDHLSVSNYTSFIKKYNPKYSRKRIDEIFNKENSKTISEIKRHSLLSKDDIVRLIIDIGENKYSKKLKQENVNEYIISEEE